MTAIVQMLCPRLLAKQFTRIGIIHLFGIASFAGTLYSVLPIPHPGSPGTADIFGPNNLGEVTGYLDQDGTITNFIASTSGFQLFPAPSPPLRGFAIGINDSGQVAENSSSFPSNVISPAFIVTTADVKPIPLPSPAYSGSPNVPGYFGASATGINGSGELAGTAYGSNVSNEIFIGTPTAITLIPLPSGWQPGGLYGFNDAGQVVGELTTNGTVGTYVPFVGTTSGVTFITQPAGWELTYAGAINDTGEVAGYGGPPEQGGYGPDQAFVWSPNSGPTLIPLPAGATFGGLDLGEPEINSSGVVVGYSDAGAWIWDSGDGVRLLNTLVPAGWTIDGASGINNAGQILATASFEGSRIDYVLLTPESVSVPEPGPMILVGLGLLFIGISRFNRLETHSSCAKP
jgi:hypothetical protein